MIKTTSKSSSCLFSGSSSAVNRGEGSKKGPTNVQFMAAATSALPSYGHVNGQIGPQSQFHFHVPPTGFMQKRYSATRENRKELYRRMRLKIQEEQADHMILNGPPCPEPDKESIRKDIQRRIRLKMIRKGQIPPNPTLEELQLCGLQPIGAGPISSFPPTMPPSAYFAPPMPFGAYQNGQLPPHLFPPHYHPMFQQIIPMPEGCSNGHLNVAQQTQPSSFHGQADSEPSSATTLSPSGFDVNSGYFDCQFDDSHRSEPSPTSTVASSEPFILPEREYPPSTFEAFFGSDFIL